MNKSATNKKPHDVLQFLIELRRRLMYALIVLFAVFAVLLFFANDLYTFLAQPLLKFLPQGHLIATQVVSPFFVPFKLALMTALLLAAPFFLYQIWAFIAPALYGYERKMLWPFLMVSTGLFYFGIAFAYLVIFPMLFKFLARVAPQGVELSPDISEYLDFTSKILMTFGALFEIPMIMFILVTAGVVQRQQFIKMRPYAIVSAFIVGMLLAPPDVFSQTILALPIWFLYETGLVLTRFAKRRSHAETHQ